MPDLEADVAIHRLCTTGDYSGAANHAITVYKPEILRYLKWRLRNNADLHDVFSSFCEDVWRGLESFHWRCSLRAWLYTLARNAQSRFLRSPQRRVRSVAIDDLPFAAANDPRTATARCQRTGVKQRFRELRRQLSDEDQLLLKLRVDYVMSWAEISTVMLADASASEPEMTREIARVRKRFQLIKNRLRQLAAKQGLLDDSHNTSNPH